MTKLHIRRFLRRNTKIIVVSFALATVLQLSLHYNLMKKPSESLELFNEDLSMIGIQEYPVADNFGRRDWHDYEFMKYESERKGIGEQGAGLTLTDPDDIELDKKLSEEEGIHVVVSDKISLNRSVIDTRDYR